MYKLIVTQNTPGKVEQKMYNVFYNGYKERIKYNWWYRTEKTKLDFLNDVVIRFNELFPLNVVKIEVEDFTVIGSEDSNCFYVYYEQ